MKRKPSRKSVTAARRRQAQYRKANRAAKEAAINAAAQRAISIAVLMTNWDMGNGHV